MIGKINLNPALARQFLSALYSSFFSQKSALAFMEVRGKAESGPMSFRRFYRSPEALLKDMARWKPGLNYWIGVALRRDNRGGKKENLLALTAAFCDVDVGPAGHKNAPKYQTKDEARAAVEQFPLRPTMLIDSGGGFQCYWLFREAVRLTAAEGPQAGTPAPLDAHPMIAQVKGINRALALPLGGDVAATDAARILRLPGTFNMKLAGNPRPVGIIWCEPERVYDLAEFAKYEAQGRQRGPQAGTPAPQGEDARPTRTPTALWGGSGGEYEAYASRALADEIAALARTPEGERNARLNQAAFALGQLVGAGVLDRGVVEVALTDVATSIGLGEVETRATIQSGLDSGIKEPRELPERAKKGGGGPRPGVSQGSGEKGRQAELGIERAQGRPKGEAGPHATQKHQAEPTLAPSTSFLPIPPAFPLDVFPTIYQQALREFQEAYAVPMEIPACALLSVAGTCIGRTRGVLIKSGWIEHGNLWLVIVGKSGIGKSPCVRAIFRPIFEVEKRWYADYQEAYKQYQYELDQRQACPKRERAALPPPPAPPVWNQLFVDDATTEALTDALAANPRGILWNRDELSGLILDLDKYAGKDGGTKSRMMSAYDSGLWKVNRKDNSKKALIPNATLSIFGTIQPKALPTIFSNLDAATGFLPRFIFVAAVQETPPFWTDKTVSEGAAQDLSRLVEGLLQFELDEEGTSQIIGVNREAQAIYHDWYNDKVMAPWRNTEAEIYEAVLAKLRGQALRICLILHYMDSVANHKSELAPVSADTMRKALRLADFFEMHQKNAWQTIITEGAAATLTPMQRQVVTAILNLESEIKGGLIHTARVTEEINRGFDERFALSARAVGRAAASLGLKTRHLPGGMGRGIAVAPTDFEKFKNISRTSVPSVPSGSNSDSARSFGYNASVPLMSLVSQTAQADDERGHIGNLPGPSDTCRKVISQETMAAWDVAISQVVEEAVRAIDVHTDDLLALAGGEI